MKAIGISSILPISTNHNGRCRKACFFVSVRAALVFLCIGIAGLGSVSLQAEDEEISSISDNLRSEPPGYRAEPIGYQPHPSGYRSEPVGFREKNAGYREEPPGFREFPPGYTQTPAGFLENSPLLNESGRLRLAVEDLTSSMVTDKLREVPPNYLKEPSIAVESSGLSSD